MKYSLFLAVFLSLFFAFNVRADETDSANTYSVDSTFSTYSTDNADYYLAQINSKLATVLDYLKSEVSNTNCLIDIFDLMDSDLINTSVVDSLDELTASIKNLNTTSVNVDFENINHEIQQTRDFISVFAFMLCILIGVSCGCIMWSKIDV